MTPQRAALITLTLFAFAAGWNNPAWADSTGLRPLGAEFESARTVGAKHLVMEAGVWAPQFDDPTSLSPTAAELAILGHWQALPVWPEVRGLYGLDDGNEVELHLGPSLEGGYRKLFLRADAPWGGEYLQVLLQVGGGFNLASLRPTGYVRIPALYETGPLTFHLAGGGYYLFNQQPIVEAQGGLEWRVWGPFTLGGSVDLRMDAKALTPQSGSWSYGAGLRCQLGEHASVQVEARRDDGPPTPTGGTTANPRVEFPYNALQAGLTYFWP